MSMTIDQLMDLRNGALDAYLAGDLSDADCRVDVAAIAVELDRILTTPGEIPLEKRAGRVVQVILTDSRARLAAVPPAKTARVEFWHRRRTERMRQEDPAGLKTEQREGVDLEPVETDEVRMARPILAALGDKAIVESARELVLAIAERQKLDVSPEDSPAFPDVVWSDNDRLAWEEFIGGVPCQGCGHSFLGHETGQRDGETWSAYRERMELVEAEFLARHPDHGVRWTVAGGPFHCRRCCAPHPLSPQQIAAMNQLVSPPTPSPAQAPSVRRCGTCHEPLEPDHVCQVENLPRRLRAVVEAVLTRERSRQE